MRGWLGLVFGILGIVARGQVSFVSNDVISTADIFYHTGSFVANDSLIITGPSTVSFRIVGDAQFNAQFVQLTTGKVVEFDGDLALNGYRQNSGGIVYVRGNLSGTLNESDLSLSTFGELVLDGDGTQTITGLHNMGGDVRISNNTGPISITGTNSALISNDILEFGSRVDVAPDAFFWLSFPPASLTDPGSATAFINGPILFTRANAPAATGQIPFLGSGGVMLFEPFLVTAQRFENGSPGGGVRLEAVAGGTNGTGAAGSRFGRLSAERYLRFSPALPYRPNSVLITQIELEYRGETAYPVAEHVRLGGKQTDANPAGTYLPYASVTNDVVNKDLTVAVNATVGDDPPAPELFLTFGVAKVDAGTVTSVVPPPVVPNVETVVCPTDTAELSLTGLDAGSVQWQESPVGGGAGFSPSVGGDLTGLLTGAVSSETFYRVVAEDGPTFEPDTSNEFRLDLAPSIAMQARAFLEGPYVSGTRSMNAYPDPVDLREVYTTQPDPEDNMYASGSVPPGAVDVVELELWYSLDPGAVVAGSQTRAWLLSDGSLVDFRTGDIARTTVYSCDAGVSVVAGSYHVAIRHRNHLPMITATPIAFADGVPTVVDFTDEALIYTQFPAIQLGGRYYATDDAMALFAANVTDEAGISIQFVNSLDYSRVIEDNGTLVGYVLEDVNCDGVVNAADVLVVQMNNDQLRYSNVPD